MSRARSLWCVLLLAVMAALPLGGVLFSGKAIGPFDWIAPMTGAVDVPKPEQNWDILQADGVLQFYNWRDLVFEAWGRGEWPFWNPYQLAGTPLLANSQSAAFYSPHIAMGILHVPTPVAMKLLAWFHLFWAGLGAFLLARRLGASEAGGLVAGGLFGTSAFLVAWVALPSVPTTCAWIPWCLWSIVRLFDEADRAPLPRRATPLALCVAMLVLGGHLQFVAYGLMATGFVWLWLLVQKRAWKAGLIGLGGLLAGGMLASPQLLPVLEYGRFSHRANTPSEEGYAGYVASALQAYELPALVSLTLLGHPGPLNEAGALPNYWPALAKRGANPAESAATVGPLALALIGLGLATRRLRQGAWPFAVMAGLGLLLAMGTPLNRALYFGLPGWSSSGSPGRIVVLTVLAAAVLAGLAVPKQGEDGLPERRVLGGATVGLLATLVALGVAARGVEVTWIEGFGAGSIAAMAAQSARAGVLPPLILAVLAVVVLVVVARRGWKDGEVLVGMAVPLVAGVLFYGGWVPTGTPPVAASAKDPSRVAFVNDRWDLLVPAPALMPPNTATAGRVVDLAGYDSLLHRDTVKMLADIMGQDPAPPANGNIMLVKSSADPNKLREAGVTTVYARSVVAALGTPRQAADNLYAYDLGGPGRASTPHGAATFEQDGLDRTVVRATGPGTLVLRDRNMPGWSASVDGEPAELRGDRWREVDLPEGEHRVEFRYRPPGLQRGLTLCIVGVGALVLAGVLGRSRRSVPASPGTG
ncbi:MAG: hypothetical protein KIS66_07355 [Fimbriimonadaceae bacterium]|nr:hypothetical protein [Fimbriimonadaceae bacterium]